MRAILWVMPEPPQHPGLGGAQRMYWIIRGVREAMPGVRHYGVAFHDTRFQSGLERALPLFDELHLLKGAQMQDVENTAAQLFSRLQPSEFAYAASWWLPYLGPLRDKAIALLGAHPDIDVVHIDHLQLAPLAMPLRRHTRAPVAITAHNTYSLMSGNERVKPHLLHQLGRRFLGTAAAAAHLTPIPWYDKTRRQAAARAARLAGRIDLGRHSKLAGELLDAWYSAKADLVFCMSEDEAHLLGQMGAPVSVAPNGASLAHLEPVFQARQPMTKLIPRVPVFGFVGAAAYPPYQTACDLMLQAFSGPGELGRVRLIGYQMREQVSRMASFAGCQTVTIVDGPPDIRPHLIDLEAMVLPIFSGAGTRLKVVEAVFAGIPLVASAKAVEGLDLEPGKDCALIEHPTPDAIRRAVRTFLGQRDWFTDRVNALRERWKKRYDWLAIGSNVARKLEQLAN